MATYGWNGPTQFWCYFDNEGYIVMQEVTGQFKRIGVSLQKYQQTEKIATEAVEKAEGYLKTLEEHGLIQRELTADEKLAVLSTQVETLTKLMEQQAHMIGALTNRPVAVTPEIVTETPGGSNVQSATDSRSGEIVVSQ